MTSRTPKMKFAQSYAFQSTSAASSVCTGRSANGTIEWKLKGSKKTYKEWEAEKLLEE